MNGKLGTFIAVCVAAPFVVVLAMVLVTVMAVSGPIFEAVDANQGPGGVGKDSISFGGAILLFASAGMISVPSAILLKLMIGGRRPRAPPQQGGPF